MRSEAGGPASVKRSFAPVVDASVRLLVLGSLPGDISLAEARYYANPHNQFWRLMGAVIDRDLDVMDYGARLQALLRAGVGLWDVIESASRTGSLDGRIRGHKPNRLAELIAEHPHIAAVAFNGSTAAAIGRRQLADPHGPALIDLPSSSPARTLPFERKRDRWLELRRWL